MMTDKEKEYINLFAKYVCSIRPYPGKTTKWGAEKPIEVKIKELKQFDDFQRTHSSLQETVTRGRMMLQQAYRMVEEACKHGSSKEHPFVVGLYGLTKEGTTRYKERLEEIFKKWGIAEIIKLEVVEVKKKKPQKTQMFMDVFWKPKEEK